MSKRKARARREDPRTWTYAEWLKRFERDVKARIKRRVLHELDSPYIDTILNPQALRRRLRILRECEQ